MKICGKCLHSIDAHVPHNGHYMYCSCCFSTCHIELFNLQHKPTSYKEVCRMSALKQ